ncbi:hypothetical protein AB0I82_35815 [Streptomyces sp. NPDC050315]|uniref:hypothetical protein n=1 Tax=Streptomyces sp. NPDC050315 TaxID=3155039 RepID=UPI0034495AD0
MLFLAACTLFAVSACGTDSEGTPENKPKSKPSPTVSVDPQAAEKKQVLKVYRSMWETKNRSFAKAELDPDVKKYASGKALGDIKVTTLYYEGRGHVMKGEPILHPEVTAIDTKSKPAKATVEDCVDSSHYDEVDKKTGKKVDFGDGPRRHPNSTTLRMIGDKWFVWETSIDRERSC